MEEKKPQSNNQDNLKTVRTYLSDMADTVRENEISVIKVALAEQNKHEREDLYRKVEGTTGKKIFWAIGGIILIAGAIYGSYFLIQQKEKNNIQDKIIKDESIISYDETSSIVITEKDNLLTKLGESRKEYSLLGKNSSIRSISLSENIGGVVSKIITGSLFSKMEFTAPSSLTRSLSDSYMVGTYTRNGNTESNPTNSEPKLFIILKTNDYESTYAGMLEWEKTIASDMFDVFGLNSKENKLKLIERPWKDIVINNKDARVLYNEENNPILYYIFADKSNLIITDNIEAIKEIISRLIIKNIKPL